MILKRKRTATVATKTSAVRMKERHEKLRAHYDHEPAAATITDFATTAGNFVSPTDALHSEVSLCRHSQFSCPIGVHTAVGGESDQPTPGDLLCGALAACLDSTLRIIANRIGVELRELAVEVQGRVDVRGTLRFDRHVPIGFQHFDVNVKLRTAPWVPDLIVRKMLRAAETSCVVMQTLKPGASIKISRTR